VRIQYIHRCNVAKKIGVGGGKNRPSILGTSNYEGVNLEGWWIGLNQFLIYIHPFPPISPQFLLFSHLQISSLIIVLRYKNTGDAFVPPWPPSYTCVYVFKRNTLFSETDLWPTSGREVTEVNTVFCRADGSIFRPRTTSVVKRHLMNRLCARRVTRNVN
jgi:hypothetical protein